MQYGLRRVSPTSTSPERPKLAFSVPDSPWMPSGCVVKNNIADFKLKIDLIPTQIVMFVPVRQLSVADRSLKLFSELN